MLVRQREEQIFRIKQKRYGWDLPPLNPKYRSFNKRAHNMSEMGQPCRVLLDIENGSRNTPFALTEAWGAEYTLEIHWSIWSPEPHMYEDRVNEGPVHPLKGLLSIIT